VLLSRAVIGFLTTEYATHTGLASETPSCMMAEQRAERTCRAQTTGGIMKDDAIPTGPDGRPFAKVTMGAEEKIGLPNYSNVTLNGWVTRYVEDTPEAIDAGLRDCVSAVEAVIAEERQAVLAMVQGK
jgi:hypothetical protein